MNMKPVFPTWRAEWNRIDGVAPLLDAADAALKRRSRGNHLMPKPVPLTTDSLGITLAEVQRWAKGEAPSDGAARVAAAAHHYAALEPLLVSSRWSRWLLLERAFVDASETGDLAFAAVTLRTLCEEVQRLLCLDIEISEIQRLAASSEMTDQDRLQLYFRTVHESLGPASDPRVFDPKDSAIVDKSALPNLQSAKQSLNDYVHPNYGSHIAALYPERSAAPQILLVALVETYAAFCQLTWAEQPLKTLGAPLKLGPLRTWARTIRRFEKHVLPTMQDKAARRIADGSLDTLGQDVFRMDSVLAWLTASHDGARAMLASSDLESLVSSLRRPGHGSTSSADAYRLWEGASETDVLFVATARRAEQVVTNAFPCGAPDQDDQQRWLHFLALALQLAITLGEIKLASFKAQIVRQIVAGNILGILLCARSILEHQAVAAWLSDRLGNNWAEVGKRVAPEQRLPKHSSEMQKDLARYLAGTKGTAEQELPWTRRADGGRWALHLGSRLITSS